ncbi:unnamed protein product [Acanthosepion pharaonis]|uniref:Uncharacterized protein n=1 Tax=Acanthosepion pharaonis TaxID=158019 RepID=A0A812C9F2_ACAPH|nr:unnamed protein product [Sepia pharaonis]
MLHSYQELTIGMHSIFAFLSRSWPGAKSSLYCILIKEAGHWPQIESICILIKKLAIGSQIDSMLHSYQRSRAPNRVYICILIKKLAIGAKSILYFHSFKKLAIGPNRVYVAFLSSWPGAKIDSIFAFLSEAGHRPKSNRFYDAKSILCLLSKLAIGPKSSLCCILIKEAGHWSRPSLCCILIKKLAIGPKSILYCILIKKAIGAKSILCPQMHLSWPGGQIEIESMLHSYQEAGHWPQIESMLHSYQEAGHRRQSILCCILIKKLAIGAKSSLCCILIKKLAFIGAIGPKSSLCFLFLSNSYQNGRQIESMLHSYQEAGHRRQIDSMFHSYQEAGHRRQIESMLHSYQEAGHGPKSSLCSFLYWPKSILCCILIKCWPLAPFI